MRVKLYFLKKQHLNGWRLYFSCDVRDFIMNNEFKDQSCFFPSLSSVWQWRGDDGQWEAYSPSASAMLDSAVSSGQTSFTLTLDSGASYNVDLKKMVQINPVTKYKRKIRCQKVKQGERWVRFTFFYYFTRSKAGLKNTDFLFSLQKSWMKAATWLLVMTL